MAYDPSVFVDVPEGEEPPPGAPDLDAAEFNKIGAGIKAAHDDIALLDGRVDTLEAEAGGTGDVTDAELAAGLATKANTVHIHTEYLDQAAGDNRYILQTNAAGFATDTELAAGLDTKAATADVVSLNGRVNDLEVAPPAHAHTIGDITAPGTRDDTTFLRGDGTFAQPPAGTGGGVTDHGALTGLTDDDHTQYHTDARGDVRYYPRADVDTALAAKAPTTRTISAGTGLTGGGDLTANRSLAVSYGTVTGTAAQGNDTRITGAAQKSANLSDLASVTTARTNLGLAAAAASGKLVDLTDVATTTAAVGKHLAVAAVDGSNNATSFSLVDGENGTTAIRYVSPTGSDSNTGLTTSSALATVAAAYAALPAAGGEIRMLPGVHTSATTTTISNTVANRNKPVTIRGAGVQRTIWRRTADVTLFRLAGVDGTAGNGAEFVSEVNVSDMTFDGQGVDAGGPGYGSNLVELLEVNHVIFERVRFYNVKGSGVYGRTVENSKFIFCRFSALATTVGSNLAGVELVNGTNLETNGVRWESCDFEITYGGKDIHILGDITRKAQNFVVLNCKFESAPLSSGAYAPGQRVHLERCDDVLILGCKFIRGLGTQLDASLSAKIRVFGCEFLDGQGAYAVHFQDGDFHVIEASTIQGSAAMSTAGGAHLRVGATANVKIGITRHLVVGTEKKIDDLSGAGRRVMMTADVIGLPMTFQKTNVTASGSGSMGTIQGSAVEYVVPRAGKIVAVTAYSSSVITAGQITFTVGKNGADTVLAVVLNSSFKGRVSDVGYVGGVPVAAGDLVRVVWAADASIAPLTTFLNAVVYFTPDPVT